MISPTSLGRQGRHVFPKMPGKMGKTCLPQNVRVDGEDIVPNVFPNLSYVIPVVPEVFPDLSYVLPIVPIIPEVFPDLFYVLPVVPKVFPNLPDFPNVVPVVPDVFPSLSDLPGTTGMTCHPHHPQGLPRPP